MKSMRWFWILSALGWLGMTAMGTRAVRAEVVIANHDLGVKELSRSTVRGIFLGRTTRLHNGHPVVFAVLAGGDIHGAFMRNVVHKSPAQFSRYWLKLVFSGKGHEPVVLGTEQEMIEFVSSTPGAVGYVSSAPAREGVATIEVVE